MRSGIGIGDLMSMDETVVRLLSQGIENNGNAIRDLGKKVDLIPAAVATQIKTCKEEHQKINIPAKLWVLLAAALLSALGIGWGGGNILDSGPQKANVTAQK